LSKLVSKRLNVKYLGTEIVSLYFEVIIGGLITQEELKLVTLLNSMEKSESFDLVSED
jgi:hypothetical protein